MLSRVTGENSTEYRTGGTRGIAIAAALMTSIALVFAMIYQAMAAEPANSYFEATWERTDDPVASGLIGRTWMWGPEGITGELTEAYAESPGGERTVQYFDKSRMEITDPSAPTNSLWYVTNGLLVVELVTGQMQMGDNDFEQRSPAEVNVAGDQDVTSVQYATLVSLLDAPALVDGASITQRIDTSGTVTDDPSLASFGVAAAHLVSVPGIEHQVASPFWTFINSTGMVYENGAYIDAPMFLSPFYATGYPITEAYWANVKVAGTYQDVLLQCFERRCLTYTPGNESGWQVEAGNVGQHYYKWRYGQAGITPPVTGTEEPSATATPPDNGTVEPPATGTPPASPTAEPTAEPSPTVEPSPTATATPAEPRDYSYVAKFGEQVDYDTEFDEPSGVGVGPDGSVYILENGTDRIQQYTPDGVFVRMWGESGSGTGQFDTPRAIAFDAAGNIYVSDWHNDRIQKFDPNGNYDDQIGSAGFDDGEFFTVYGIAFDSQGYLYAADTNSHRIQKFDRNGNFVDKWEGGSSLTGGGSSGPGEFAWPLGLAIDELDVIYVVDAGNHRIQKFGTDGTYLGEWGSHGSGNGQFDYPTGIAISEDGIVYVADFYNNRIQAFDTDGNFRGKWGGSGSDLGQFDYPEGVAADSDGNVYVTDQNNNRVQKFDARGNFLDSWIGAHRGRFDIGAASMTLDEDGNVYVAEVGRVQKFDAGGRFIWEVSELSHPVDFDVPSGVAASLDGYLFIADSNYQKIVKFTLDGEIVDEWNGVGRVRGLALDSDGDLYAMEFDTRQLRKYSTGGASLGSWDMSAVLSGPFDIAIDGGRLYVTDVDPVVLLGGPSGAGAVPAVKIFDLDDRSFLGTLGESGQFTVPIGIGIDPDGYIYVTDMEADTVQQFAPNGTYLATIGGPGSGNGRFDTPADVEISSDGTLYVLDTLNYRVQVFE